MEIFATINLEDKNGNEHEINCTVDFDGEITRQGVSAYVDENSTVLLSAEFAGIEFGNIEILLDNHFTGYELPIVMEMIYEQVSASLECEYETQYC